MRAIRHILFCSFLAFFACNGREMGSTTDTSKVTLKHGRSFKKDGFVPYRLVDDYMVTDTGFFDFGLGDGTYAVIKCGNRLIDTIDKCYGFQLVDDGTYMYCVINGQGLLHENDSKSNSIRADVGSFIIMKGNKKIDLTNKAPDFGWFANPSIINHRVYYWQVKDVGENNKVFAAEFNPKKGLTVSHYLFDDYIETDDGGYFATPFIIGDTICFEHNDGKTSKFNKDFKPYN